MGQPSSVCACRSACLPDEQWTRDWKAREGAWERQLMDTKGAIAGEWYGVGVGSGRVRRFELAGTTSCKSAAESTSSARKSLHQVQCESHLSCDSI